jgi:hypothetical protein
MSGCCVGGEMTVVGLTTDIARRRNGSDYLSVFI